MIGIDAGGTFTDCVVGAVDGRLAVGKALSTPDRIEDGVVASLEDAAGRLGVGVADLLASTDVLAHGTTVGLNALLTGAGAKVGLLTTAGFESTLAIAKANKVLGLSEAALEQPTSWDKPALLVPRRLTRGVAERIDASGRVVRPLDLDQARTAVEALAGHGVESVAVALLWSVANPVHEQQLATVVRQVLPGAHLSLSSELVPKLGEYERTSTVVVDAYVGPLVSSYLARLEGRLRQLGFGGLFVIMRMGGGVLPVELAQRMPVHTLHSGPVGGVAAAAKIGERLAQTNIITTDVGGTSFDVGLVTDRRVLYSSKPMIERHALAIPVVDVTSIGTGGGSLAWIDRRLGALRIGPASAGAVPGPACYGLGGTAPTVSDAAVVLGYVDHLGPSLRLDREAATMALKTVADPLGLDVVEAAEGIVQVACEQMRDLIRRTTVQRGHDPRDFVLYAFGGAGPQYAGRYARGLGVSEVVIPLLAAEFSGFGAVVSDLVSALETDIAPADLRAALGEINAGLAEMVAAARRQLEQAAVLRRGVGLELETTRTVGLRFYRQIHRIDIDVDDGAATVDGAEADRLLAAFRQRYERVVGAGTARPDTPIEVVTLGVRMSLRVPPVVPSLTGAVPAAAERVRPAFFDGVQVPVPAYRWDRLAAGQEIEGPAFIESDQTTVVVYPGQWCRTDHLGNVRLTLEPAR